MNRFAAGNPANPAGTAAFAVAQGSLNTSESINTSKTGIGIGLNPWNPFCDKLTSMLVIEAWGKVACFDRRKFKDRLPFGLDRPTPANIILRRVLTIVKKTSGILDFLGKRRAGNPSFFLLFRRGGGSCSGT
jgi:hypothetical protein